MTQETILTISQITQAIKLQLEGTFPSLTLQGEISNFKQHASGHLYFSLKDANATISAVMYRGDTLSMRSPPKDGDHVIVKGSITVYPPRGNYQLTVKEMALAGQGELLLKLQELKIKLHKKGYFLKSRKKSLPTLPRTIGVVTSPTGAVIQDILHILCRRQAGFHLVLNPVKVQGEGAAQEIAKAIDDFNRFSLADVLIIGRGGGSIEDLWAFNEEIVAEAIYDSRIPIIAAVGHETDHCIAEYVADMRAPTPSAAAEMVMAEKAQLDQHLNRVKLHIRQTLQHQIGKYRQYLKSFLKQPAFASPYSFVGPWMQRLDDIKIHVDQLIYHNFEEKSLHLRSLERQLHTLKPSSRITTFQSRLHSLQKGIDNAILRQLTQIKARIPEWSKQLNFQWQRNFPPKKVGLDTLSCHLMAIDPKNLLKKGYTILFSEKDKSVITSVKAMQLEQKVRMILADGEASATLNEIFPK